MLCSLPLVANLSIVSLQKRPQATIVSNDKKLCCWVLEGPLRPHLHKEDASGSGLRNHFTHFRGGHAHGLLAQDGLARCQAEQHGGLVLGVLGADVGHL